MQDKSLPSIIILKKVFPARLIPKQDHQITANIQKEKISPCVRLAIGKVSCYDKSRLRPASIPQSSFAGYCRQSQSQRQSEAGPNPPHATLDTSFGHRTVG